MTAIIHGILIIIDCAGQAKHEIQVFKKSASFLKAECIQTTKILIFPYNPQKLDQTGE